MSKRAGTIEIKVDGRLYEAVGSFTYSLGKPTREALLGHDSVHGYKELPSVPFIEGEFRDGAGVSLDDISNITDATVTLSLANGKVIVLRNAWCTNPDGLGAGTEDGNIAVRFEGKKGEEVSA